MKLNTTFVIIMVSIFYLVFPFLIMLIRNKKTQKILSIVSFCIFIAILIVGTLGKIDISKTTTTISFQKFGNWFDKNISFSFSHLTKQDIIINLLMLIPIGTFTCYCFENLKTWKKIFISLAVGFICGMLIEFCQFMFPVPRSVQLSDIIFNAISVLFGALICVLYQFIINKIYSNKNKEQKL